MTLLRDFPLSLHQQKQKEQEILQKQLKQQKHYEKDDEPGYRSRYGNDDEC